MISRDKVYCGKEQKIILEIQNGRYSILMEEKDKYSSKKYLVEDIAKEYRVALSIFEEICSLEIDGENLREAVYELLSKRNMLNV